MDNSERVKNATLELARLILKENDVAPQVLDRALRLLRPARSNGSALVGPIKNQIRQKIIAHANTNSSVSGANLVATFDKLFDKLRSSLPNSSPLGTNLVYSFIQIVEPLCFSLVSNNDNFFNSTFLLPPTAANFSLSSGGINDQLIGLSPGAKPIDVPSVPSTTNDESLLGEKTSADVMVDPLDTIWVNRSTEILVMRDLLYIFQGIAGLKQPAKDVILSLCEIGWLYNKIETFLDQLLQPNVEMDSVNLMNPDRNAGTPVNGDLFRGLVPQAFAYAVQEELHDYYRLLAVLELELSKSATKGATKSGTGAVVAADASSGGVEYNGLTLLRMHTWMQQPFDRLFCIARLVEAISALSGGALVSRLHKYTLHGDVRMSEFSQRIMQSVCAPIYHMIARWILYGELQDPYNEFFIGCRGSSTSTKALSFNDQQLWNDVYFIRSNMLPTFIPLALAKQIFLIGKSINFLRHCKQKLSTMPATPAVSTGKISSSNYNQRYHDKNNSHSLIKAFTSASSKEASSASVVQPPQLKTEKKRNGRVQYLFGRKFVNRAAMPRPSVAEALGYQQHTPDTEAQSPMDMGDMDFSKKHPSMDLQGFKFDPIEEEEDDEFHYSDDESDFDTDEEIPNEVVMGKMNLALTKVGEDFDESEYAEADGMLEKDIDNVTSDLTSAWMLRDKELENAIRNLQYNSNVITYNYDEKENSTQFEEWIIRISSTVDRKLLSMLETKFHLTTHLAALKKFILLGQGDFVIYLMDNMGQELKKRANQLYRHNLTGLLEGALRSSNAQYEPSFILDRIGIRLLEPQPGDTGWEIFSLDYMIDFPLSAIIHSTALAKYHVIFHMLWRLKRVEWVLADSWEQLMEFKRNRGLVILPKLYPIIHKCTLYRMRMLHVINNLSAFLMFEVLETAWHKLERGIQSRANNLDDIIMLHDNYLDEILSKALLTPAYETLNLQIQQVIQTVLRFCGLEDALIFDANTSMQRKRSSQAGVGINTSSWSVEDSVLENPVGTIEGVPSYVITRLDDAFEDFNNQLYTLMSMLNEQGGEIGEILRFLTFRLDYNNFLSEQQPPAVSASNATLNHGVADMNYSNISHRSATKMETPPTHKNNR